MDESTDILDAIEAAKMPWKTGSSVSEVRSSLLRDHARGVPIEELCAFYGVSRSTVYSLVARARRVGDDVAVLDQSRAPLSSPHRLKPFVVENILTLREQFGFGAKKLRVLYEEHFGAAPSRSAIANVLRAQALVRPYRRRQRYRPVSAQRLEATQPNDVWAVDHKGSMGRQRVEPLTVVDEHSRFWLCCRPLTNKSYEDTRAAFDELFDRYGVPLMIRADGGNPWASVGPHRLTRLSAHWVALGIRVDLVSTCQENGIVERLHGTMEREMALPVDGDVREHFRKAQALYNDVRPHESLDMKRPVELYRRSTRRPVERTPSYGDCDEVKVVNKNGYIRWQGQDEFVSEALAGRSVGLRQHAPSVWTVRYYELELGRLDDRCHGLRPHPPT